MIYKEFIKRGRGEQQEKGELRGIGGGGGCSARG
jgi:hypothetical protein